MSIKLNWPVIQLIGLFFLVFLEEEEKRGSGAGPGLLGPDGRKPKNRWYTESLAAHFREVWSGEIPKKSRHTRDQGQKFSRGGFRGSGDRSRVTEIFKKRDPE